MKEEEKQIRGAAETAAEPVAEPATGLSEPPELALIAEPLLSWFAEHARELPWRSDPRPYRVWISEIMLQQTRVEAVKPYFERFLTALPDVAALAACPDDRLMKLWEGLGYYSRARNLKRAAGVIMERYGGELPQEPEELLKLPGIGPYTAGAISSIAYGKRAAAVDGNVLRVVTRLTADDTDIMKAAFRRATEKRLAAVMPEGRTGDFNQAMMELGATVCGPNGDPQCGECPCRGFCRAHLNGCETAYPVKAGQKPRRVEARTVLLIRDGNRIVLRKRPETGLLAGLYEFPNYLGPLSEQEAVEEAERLGFYALRVRRLKKAKHIFSHVEWHMTAFLITVSETELVPEGCYLADKGEIDEAFPVPSAFQAYKESWTKKGE